MKRKPGRPLTPDQEDRAWADYGARFRTEVMPQLMSSAVFLAILDSSDPDHYPIQFATQLGLMLIYGKPIVLTRLPGVEIPPRLLAIADEVVELDMDDPASQDALADAMKRISGLLDR